MSYPVFDSIANLFYSVYGNGTIMAVVIIFLFIMILLALRANLAVILMVIIPLIGGFVLNAATTNFLSVEPWVIVMLFMLVGFIFSLFWLFFMR